MRIYFSQNEDKFVRKRIWKQTSLQGGKKIQNKNCMLSEAEFLIFREKIRYLSKLYKSMKESIYLKIAVLCSKGAYMRYSFIYKMFYWLPLKV